MYTIFNTFYYYLIFLRLSCAFQSPLVDDGFPFPHPGIVRFSYPSFPRPSARCWRAWRIDALHLTDKNGSAFLTAAR